MDDPLRAVGLVAGPADVVVVVVELDVGVGGGGGCKGNWDVRLSDGLVEDALPVGTILVEGYTT